MHDSVIKRMRNERGYICSVRFEGAEGEYWFGPKTNQKIPLDLSDRFNTNGLKPFPTKEDAEKAKAEILEKRKGVKTVNLARLELDIAETQEEITLLKGKESLVVIADREGGDKAILGSAAEGGLKIGYVPGALIETNGGLSFPNYESALYSAQEMVRQARSNSTLARFKIEPLE